MSNKEEWAGIDRRKGDRRKGDRRKSDNYEKLSNQLDIINDDLEKISFDISNINKSFRGE